MTYIYTYIYIYGGIVKFHMHWESIGNSENDNHCLNFKSNYDKMKITSIKVNLIKYFFMRNWVLKTLYSRGFTSIEVVFHCNGCIAFSGKFFSGGTSKEVRPLERGDSPRMSRRLRPGKCHGNQMSTLVQVMAWYHQVFTTKSFPEAMLTQIYFVIWYHKATMN